ncbi:hypothetical protein [Hyphomicrobium sp. CS1BSMeth3]|uniref:hypothetical protein n=1 Tax=Hyphomicrobium sp. CS1BSMeth3 TaxID=1892844 RepID=UPI000930025A|nr:hypothetical protein [Hyphomicrobium sp. CS1BSMeth3]
MLRDHEALEALGIAEKHPDARYALVYWQKIHRGESRILTLTENGKPALTIEYLTTTRAIAQIEGASPTLDVNAVCFPPLCRALGALRDTLEFTTIKPLPQLRAGHVLTTSGTIVPATLDSIQHALAGTILMPTSSSAADIVRAADTPHIIADFGYVPADMLQHIPTYPRAELHLHARETLSLPQLKGGTLRVLAQYLHLPNFEHGRIAALYTPSVHLPKFHTGILEANNLLDLDLPAFRRGDLSLHAVEYLSAPLIEHANVTAYSAKEINLPRLQDGHVRVRSAKSVHLPQHRHGTVEADVATTLSLPLHETGNVTALLASDVHLPRHREGDLLLSSVHNIDLPAFTTGELVANNLLQLDLPQHRTGAIHALHATSLTAPLHERGRISARSAENLHLPSHLEGTIAASARATIHAPRYIPTASEQRLMNGEPPLTPFPPWDHHAPER